MANAILRNAGFHGSLDIARVKVTDFLAAAKEFEFTYTFRNFFHPLLGELIEQLNKESVPGLFDPDFHARPEMSQLFFDASYPGPAGPRVKTRSFPKAIDVEPGGPYANYNWELFFHIPLAVAVHLSKNQRFAEAQRWFHYIFDPTALPDRYWKFIAFRKGPGKQIEALLALLSKPDSQCTDPEREEKARILAGYEAIKSKPFQPHVVARTRPQAYMYSVVMKYLDNLVAWGDHLFRQDTIETINEATQIYVLAANILGPRPEEVPPMGKVRPKTFAQLKAGGLDAMGNALVDLEALFPFNFGLPSGTGSDAGAAPLLGLGRTFYFCVPRNDKLLGYWDLVGDRLFKIRHCMNIEGVVRQLALFDPPLDVAMLVKAAAAGIDIGAIVAGLNQPASPVRAQLLIEKALELCGEVRGLGGALLSAIEKGDSERMALLRQGHEIRIQQMQQEVRFLQWKQAQQATEALLTTRAVTLERYKYYLRLLGRTPDRNLAPDSFVLDRRELTEENFDEAHAALVDQYVKEVPLPGYPRLDLAEGGSPAGQAGATGEGAFALTTGESAEISQLETAKYTNLAASILSALASPFAMIPDAKGNMHYWGLGISLNLKTGTALTKGAELLSQAGQLIAAYESAQAGLSARTAGHQRRADDWILQANLAGRELQQIGRQILSSLIAEQIAQREYRNVQEQIEQSQEVDRFLRDKFSNADLYGWMQGELSRLYYEYYRFAFDVARRAEQTMRRELMRPELDGNSLIQFNYWDAGRKGLLSGEALYLDIKRMEMAYHEHNLREYELTKHVSLLQVDPLALIRLRATGRCTLRLPEALFDIDGPGHYCRRIRSVALTIPCVTGPHVGINCKLTLLRSEIRKVPLLKDDLYERQGPEDDRFQDFFGSVQSIVASSGQQDAGLFEINLRDERPLPFEGAGAISEWQIELPANPSADDPVLFDYDSISDIILHIRFTAREAGEVIRRKALDRFKELVADDDAAGSMRLFSVRHEFPTEWARFTSQVSAPGQRRELALTLRAEHYPFWSQGRLNVVKRVDLLAASAAKPVPPSINVAGVAGAGAATDALARQPALDDLLTGRLTNVPRPAAPTGDVRLFFDAELSDLWIALTWSG